jgi:hypothetical protein
MSVMIARGVLANPSVFRREGMLPLYDVARDVLLKCVEHDLIIQGTKYILMEMMCPRRHSFSKVPRKSNLHFTEFGGPTFEQVTRSKTVAELCDLFHVTDEYQAIRATFAARRRGGSSECAAELPAHKFDEAYFLQDERKHGEDEGLTALTKRTRADGEEKHGEHGLLSCGEVETIAGCVSKMARAR